jgi:uncharacterized protein (TIGR04255 family)
LIQVQADRFVFNWRKVAGTEQYRRYEYTKPAFQREWERFCVFLKSNAIDAPNVRQCEVIYVNHIEKGNGWETFGDLSAVLPCWAGGSTDGFLPVPENVELQASYPLPQSRGRLHVTVQRGIRHVDAKEILQLTLTARGKPASSDIQDILGWFDLGHEWIVKGFADFTSKAMHSLWKRKP